MGAAHVSKAHFNHRYVTRHSSIFIDSFILAFNFHNNDYCDKAFYNLKPLLQELCATVNIDLSSYS